MSTSDKEKGCKPTPTSNAGLTKHLESGTEHTLSTVVIENLDNMKKAIDNKMAQLGVGNCDVTQFYMCIILTNFSRYYLDNGTGFMSQQALMGGVENFKHEDSEKGMGMAGIGWNMNIALSINEGGIYYVVSFSGDTHTLLIVTKFENEIQIVNGCDYATNSLKCRELINSIIPDTGTFQFALKKKRDDILYVGSYDDYHDHYLELLEKEIKNYKGWKGEDAIPKEEIDDINKFISQIYTDNIPKYINKEKNIKHNFLNDMTKMCDFNIFFKKTDREARLIFPNPSIPSAYVECGDKYLIYPLTKSGVKKKTKPQKLTKEEFNKSGLIQFSTTNIYTTEKHGCGNIVNIVKVNISETLCSKARFILENERVIGYKNAANVNGFEPQMRHHIFDHDIKDRYLCKLELNSQKISANYSNFQTAGTFSQLHELTSYLIMDTEILKSIGYILVKDFSTKTNAISPGNHSVIMSQKKYKQLTKKTPYTGKTQSAAAVAPPASVPVSVSSASVPVSVSSAAAPAASVPVSVSSASVPVSVSSASEPVSVSSAASVPVSVSVSSPPAPAPAPAAPAAPAASVPVSVSVSSPAPPAPAAKKSTGNKVFNTKEITKKCKENYINFLNNNKKSEQMEITEVNFMNKIMEKYN